MYIIIFNTKQFLICIINMITAAQQHTHFTVHLLPFLVVQCKHTLYHKKIRTIAGQRSSLELGFSNKNKIFFRAKT